jgi:hypothetical protein
MQNTGVAMLRNPCSYMSTKNNEILTWPALIYYFPELKTTKKTPAENTATNCQQETLFRII